MYELSFALKSVLRYNFLADYKQRNINVGNVNP